MGFSKENYQEFATILHSNEGFSGNFTGANEMLMRVLGGSGVHDAYNDTFTEVLKDEAGNVRFDSDDASKPLRRTKWGKLIGSGWAAYTGAKVVGGAIHGALTDENGRLDIPGIPLI